MTESEIISDILSGDKESFGKLITSYEDKISRYIGRFIYDHESRIDVTQEVFIKAYINLKSFDLNKSFNSWIYRIAHNECINFLKKHNRADVSWVEFDTILPTLYAKEKADDKIYIEENRKLIEENLDKIDVKYKEVIVLHYIDDLSYEEISEILKVPIATVGVRLSRAKQKLKELLKDKI